MALKEINDDLGNIKIKTLLYFIKIFINFVIGN